MTRNRMVGLEKDQLVSFALSTLSIVVYVSQVRGATPATDLFTAQQRAHWAFQSVDPPQLPVVGRHDRARGAVDSYVFRRLAAAGIRPARPADRRTLLRRATLDVLGLPPSPDNVAAFVADQSPDAFDRVVDRLLASPHYGERWGRHWLDLARFAESAGFERDETRPNAWRYRDYVIEAFNADKPYDRFLSEQIAGDELWPDSIEAQIATGFNRHWPEEGNNKDLMLARQEILHDITDVVGAVFLGLTFNCARCHDHKYDPILQKDYYRLQAFFANIGHDDRFPIAATQQRKSYERRLQEWERKTQHIWDEMNALLMPKRKYTPTELLERYPDYVIEAVRTPPEQRTAIQAQLHYLLEKKDCNTCALRPKPYLDPAFKQPAGQLKGEDRKRYQQLLSQLEECSSLRPQEIARASVIRDISCDAPPTHVLGVGLYTAPKEEVQPGFLSILDPAPAAVVSPGPHSTGRRSALANWLTDPQANPLAARVMVNRIWHYHFNQGIVRTPSDFGTRGQPPTHPQLLDWMALEFVRSGWSVKRIHRHVMTSATYQQSSADREGARRINPSNRLLWRFPPHRLDAEIIRDSALAVAGLLNGEIGGASVFPPLPKGMPKPVGGWTQSKDSADQHRRSIYIFVRRNSRYPMLKAFDFPDTHESCQARNATTTAPQALALLNDPLATEWAQAFASRVAASAGIDRKQRVDVAFRLAYSRPPDEHELQLSLDFLRRQSKLIDAGADPLTDFSPSAPSAALADLCLMLMNSNEFVYRY